MTDKRIALLLFGLLMSVIVICSTILSCVFEDAQYFVSATSSVFVALLLVGLFGFPID